MIKKVKWRYFLLGFLQALNKNLSALKGNISFLEVVFPKLTENYKSKTLTLWLISFGFRGKNSHNS